MYNVFKRPMFKLGGQADQGTGIMSHVEPRPQYFNGGRVMARFGFPTFFKGKPVEAPTKTTYEIAGSAMGLSPGTGKSVYSPYGTLPMNLVDVAGVGPSSFALLSAPFVTPALLAYGNRPRTEEEARVMREYGPIDETFTEEKLQQYYKDRLEARKESMTPDTSKTDFSEYQKIQGIRGIPGQGSITSYIDPETGKLMDRKTGTPISLIEEKEEVIKKEPVYKETDTLSKVKKEQEFLKSLMDDFDSGEAALILSKAAGTPGSFAKKIQVGVEKALEAKKEKRSLNRALALKAYETVKEEEREKIKAGKKGETGQLIDQYVRGRIKAGDTRDPAIIANEFIEERYLGVGKEEGALQKNLFFEDYKSEIKPAIVKVNKYERQKQLTGKISKEEQKMLEDAKFTVNQYLKKYPQYKQYITTETLATGGRVGLAEGTQPESVVEETVMKEGPSDVAIKPVNKLSYPELRDRLPREITDDIVQLIANSEEALQDFAYIRTQRDINDFNVKYGVNLILPATK